MDEYQIYLELMGDVSDVEIENDEEVSKDGELAHVPSNEEVSPEDVQQIGERLGMPVEVIAPNITEEAGEEEVPSGSVAATRNEIRWRHRDLDVEETSCPVSFSEPLDLTALSYFKMFIDDEIIGNMVEQTNLYSVQKDGSSVDTSADEMGKFIGLHIMMGIVSLPQVHLYWQEQLRIPYISDVMPRNRFQKLRSYLHLNDNTKLVPRGQPGHDKLFKVRPLVDAIHKNLAQVEPEEFNSVDEFMIPFKGTSTLKQYMKNKPSKWGIKCFARAGISGFVYDFEIYTGKDTAGGVRSELGISGDVVIRLCQGLPQHKNFKVFIDNWFTSHLLIARLKSIGILCVGTVRSNRLRGCVFKTDAQLKQEGRGSYDYMTDMTSNVLALKWLDNKSVCLASSYVGVEPLGTVRRWSSTTNSYIEVARPAIVKEYNTNMGGVDLHDMLVALYRINIRSVRYYLRIVFHLVDMCVVNAWVLYKRHCKQRGEKHKTLIVFRAEIARALMAGMDATSQRSRGRPSNSSVVTPTSSRVRQVLPRPVDDVRYSGWGHFPEVAGKQQRCKFCIKAQTQMRCTSARNCFFGFHNKS